MENLCDMAEELVVEESVTRLEFPIWGSPRDLIVAIADGDSSSNPMAYEDITILSTGLLRSRDIKNEGPPRNFL
ncbi:hypothetical protein QJS10_CPB04g01217 [Acorus calamus]|uniref:Uncharacterized protein n=1 Tax=Acorus calamus TaxID=4465 RepID=A0AAV9F1K8_ACOCL|nr:hypothetical protein QJS10_CPB04g01217 [Acorus calamus]